MKKVFLILIFGILLTSLICADVSYRYVKWEVTEKKAVGDACVGQSCIQISEFFLLLNNNTVAWPIETSATNPNGANPDGEDAGNTIDGDVTTKWLDYNFNTGIGKLNSA